MTGVDPDAPNPPTPAPAAVTPAATDSDSFAARIRAATTAAHRDAEGGQYMKDLMAGALSAEGYAQLVAQHHAVYEALEAIGRQLADDPVVRMFDHPGLARVAALEADLQVLLGDDWRTEMVITPETAAYRDRLWEVAPTWPGGFVAHHYVRYLGDLSGGQFIARVLGGLPDERTRNAIAFYRFDELGDLDEFKVGYRQSLDAAPWDADEQARVLDEILVAYEHNTELLNGLSPAPTLG